jgi:hypothetical protein
VKCVVVCDYFGRTNVVFENVVYFISLTVCSCLLQVSDEGHPGGGRNARQREPQTDPIVRQKSPQLRSKGFFVRKRVLVCDVFDLLLLFVFFIAE